MNVVDKSLALPRWTQSAGEELANSISHGIGFLGAMIGTPILLLAAFRHGSISFLIGTIIFTGTMLLLYLGSMLYHAGLARARNFFFKRWTIQRFSCSSPERTHRSHSARCATLAA